MPGMCVCGGGVQRGWLNRAQHQVDGLYQVWFITLCTIICLTCCKNAQNSKLFFDHQTILTPWGCCGLHLLFWEVICDLLLLLPKQRSQHQNMSEHSATVIDHNTCEQQPMQRRWSPLHHDGRYSCVCCWLVSPCKGR
jgi:hypothetical protein